MASSLVGTKTSCSITTGRCFVKTTQHKAQRKVTLLPRRTVRLQVTARASSGATNTKLSERLVETTEREISKSSEAIKTIQEVPETQTKLINTALVGTFSACALAKLLTVDVGLYTNEVARDLSMIQYLSKVPIANLNAYLAACQANPLLTKAFTSCFAYGLGDFIAQALQGKSVEQIQMDRVARSATAGFFIHGPFCHEWIQWTEANLDFNGAWWNFFPKVIADQTVWSLFLNSAYTTMILSLQRIPPGEVWAEIQDTWFKVLSAGWKFWPFVHCVTFSALIPIDFKLLFVDVVEIIWVVVLSTLINKDNEQKKQCLIGEAAEFATPDSEIMIAADLEKQICMEDDEGDLFCFVPEEGCSDNDMGELFCTIPTVEDEIKPVVEKRGDPSKSLNTIVKTKTKTLKTEDVDTQTDST